MTIRTKAIAAALLLTLTPALALAQGYTNFGPGVGGAPHVNGLAPGWQHLPGTVTPVIGQDCGAHQYQGFVGQPVGAMQSYGIQARYFTPDAPYGTLDYQPNRLNVSADANYIVDRVYCG